MSDVALKRLRNVSVLRGTFDFVRYWALVSVAFALALYFDFHWAAIICAFFMVSKAQSGLLLLGHEATHWMLFPHKKWNDFWGRHFIFSTMGVGFYRARAAHLDHHRFLLTTKDEKLDQQLEVPSRKSFLIHLLMPLFGLYLFKAMKRFVGIKIKTRARPTFIYTEKEQKADLYSLIVVNVIFLAGLSLLDWRLYWLLWIMPLLTVSAAFHNAKAFLDHAVLPSQFIRNQARTSSEVKKHEHALYSYRVSWLDRLFFGTQQAFHGEHHLFPNVPYYRLHELSKVIPSKLDTIVRRQGYWQFLFCYFSETALLSGFKESSHEYRDKQLSDMQP